MPVPLSRAGVLAACALISGPVPSFAQKSKAPEPPPAIDPYTRGDPRRLAQLGYRSFGPFLFGAAANDIVQARLGDVPILWVETAHFRIGSALNESRPEDPIELAELKRELEELRAKLETFPPRAKKLDPWLRLHLLAQRLEVLHAGFCARMGVDEPEGSESRPDRLVMGMRDKLTVLVTHKKSTLGRFTREFCGQERDENVLHHFGEAGSLFFGLSEESVELGESGLHYALVHGVAQNLVLGLNGFTRMPPSWWLCGVALWFAREREPRVLLYSRPPGDALPPEELSDWEPLVRGRVEFGAALDWDEMLARPSWLGQPFGDNVVLWSRIDYFLRRPGAASPLARALHAPGEPPESGTALQRATGLDLAALDAAWQAWVRETYRKKRR